TAGSLTTNGPISLGPGARVNCETQPNNKLQLRVAFAHRACRSCFPAGFFSVAEFEFHPATRYLDLDAILAFHARSADQPTNHQYHRRRSARHLFSGPASYHGTAWAITRCGEA